MKDIKRDLSAFKKAQQIVFPKDGSSYVGYSDSHRISVVKQYTLEEVEKIIESGSITDQRALSYYFFERDGIYKRILVHYATVLAYQGLLIPNPISGMKLSEPHIKKKYVAALDYLEKMKLPTLLTRISLKVLTEGSYYGLILGLKKDKFSIIDLSSMYCRSRLYDADGNELIEFNVTYFDTIYDEKVKWAVVNSYPKIISDHYKNYHNGKVAYPWVLIPGDLGIHFSFFGDGRPFFLNVIPASIQYDDAVDNERERELEEIRKIIVQHIPHLTSTGELVFEPDEALEMHEGAVNMMKGNKNLSVLTTYADVDSVVSKTSADNTGSALEKMRQNVYAESGASELLFATTGTQALPTSIKNDIAFMMILGNKYSDFITFILNFLFSNVNVNFKYSILPVGEYNRSDYITDTLKLAQSGYSFLLPTIASGVNQRELINIKSLENDVLNLREVLVPLSSSYTQSENPVGRPPLKTEDKSPKTIQNEDAINNQGGSE